MVITCKDTVDSLSGVFTLARRGFTGKGCVSTGQIILCDGGVSRVY